VGIARVVGVAIVYQVLSSDIDNRLGEFATLKAMGYPPWFLGRVVLSQAWLLALAGFVPGLAAAAALYQVTNLLAHIPMDLGIGRVLAVLAMALAMCSLSGLAALRKVQVLDPADLFR